MPPQVIAIAGGVFWAFASIMISQTVAHAVSALFDRGDLDLLMSSPVPQRTIFLIRGLSIAMAACYLPILLLFPFAHAGVLQGRWGLLGIYPVVVALALGCAAIGIALTMSLVAMLGARRAKTAAQVMAALIGAGFFLVSQAPNMLPAATGRAMLNWFTAELQPGGWLAPDSVLWWPVRAMMGEALPLLLVMVVGAGGFWLAVNLAYRRFALGAQESVAAGGRRREHKGPVRFASGSTGLILFKEWKLLIRDPQIISQTLLQVLYLIPMLYAGMRSDRTGFLLVPGLVMMTAMLAGNLAWLTITAEDAPELLGTSPVPLARVQWIKAAAAMLPVLALLVPLTLWWLMRSPYEAVVLVLCCSGGMLSAAMCQIWNPRRGNRRDMKQRYKQSKLLGFLEVFGTLGWAGVAVCMGGYWWWLPLPLLLAAAAPFAAWLLGRTVRRDGGVSV
jgi:ABC-2 type transport system permease protein